MPDVDTMTQPKAARWIAVAACLVFVAYAGCFLYFFVDDEAIPLVYARNLLRGRGLAYTVLEGRVEGYSDFLHVLWSAALLTVTRALGFSRLAPMVIGKAVSMAAGVLIIVSIARAASRTGLRIPAVAAALAFLALAGPLAVWSASSLETVVVALTVLAFALATWQGRLEAAVVLGVLIALERIDGPVYIVCVLIAALAADPRRWRVTGQIAILTGLLIVAYHGWRLVYFGSLLSAPLMAKVLYRLTASAHTLSKIPEVAYLRGLMNVYGWTGIVVLAAAAVLSVQSALGRAALVMLVLLGLYAERVDDWMFGWRFTVAMAPFAALVIAIAIDRLPRRVAAFAAAAVCVWSVVAARTFLNIYTEKETRPIFWLAPRAGETVWLGRYGELLAAGRRLMHGGDRIAYNQAGLLPYALDLENIDDLGICSRFVARLPTTDVYYTGVGRYSPVTNAPVIRTAHAYLLYHDVKFLVTPVDLLLKANGGVIPELLLDGAFVRVHDGSLRENVIYRRTDKPIDRFGRDPFAFEENVAHYSHVFDAAVDGRPLSDAEIGPALPFLRERPLVRRFTRSLTIDITFATTDESVNALYIGHLAATRPAKLSLVLKNAAGQPVYGTDVEATPSAAQILQQMPAGTRAARLSIAVLADGENELALTDLRIQGQTDALRRYVQRTLRFPAARMVN